MKKYLAIILALTLALSLAACGGGGDSKNPGGGDTQGGDTQGSGSGNNGGGSNTNEPQDISLKVWIPEEEMELTQQLCAAFDEAHPEWNITFDISVTGIDESVNQLETDPELAADVMQVPSGSVAQCVNEGLLLPITYDIDNIKTMYGEGALASATLGDYLYAIPFSPNSYFMYYNKDMYTEEEVQSLETMMAKDLGEGVYNFSCDFTNSWYIESVFFAAGCTLFGPDGVDSTQCDFNSAAGVAATNYLIDLANNPKYVEDGDGLAGTLFKDGQLGAFCSGTWALGTDDPENGLIHVMGADKIGAVPLPTVVIGGKEARLSNFADYKTIAVKSSTKQPLAAQQLAEWLGNADSQLKRYEAVAASPTCLSLMENEIIAADFATAALIAQTEYATPQPNIPQIANYWTPMQTLGESIFLRNEVNDSNIQATLDKVVSDILSTGLGG